MEKQADEVMARYLDSIQYVGDHIKPWRDIPELATSEDEPYDNDLVPSSRRQDTRALPLDQMQEKPR